jgi:hypothetical protein
MDLWHDYERVLDLVPDRWALMAFDSVSSGPGSNPYRGQVDDAALERYARGRASTRTSLGLGVTVVIVDAAWPAWLGLEAWLLPWVAPLVVEHARRVSNP